MLSRIASKAVRRAILPSMTAVPGSFPVLSRCLMSTESAKENVIIMGAAGRDFHDFITYWSKDPNVCVKCFTETQIPGIENRHFPAEMCNNDKNGNMYPKGLTIHPEEELEDLIERYGATTCTLAYSDLNYDTVQSLAARVNAANCKFVQLPPSLTMVESSKPVISICASRTGVGKSQTTRYVADFFKERGMKVAVVRHPMPYDEDLNSQRVQRYEILEDMDKYRCTIEEREEYFSHIESGNLLFAGVDYPSILREAEKEADVVIWDGGNNDSPFFKPDLSICLVDALRPGDENHYYPGETNVRMADVVLISKVNETEIEKVDVYAEKLKSLTKPSTSIFYSNSVITPEGRDPKTGELLSEEEATAMVKGKKVLVIDDGPTLTHGGMPHGAGYAMARDLGASEIVDPRPFAKGSLAKTFRKFTHLKNVLPAMGYGEEQIRDLEATIKATPCDTIIIGTPSDITHVMDLGGKQSVVARYNFQAAEQHAHDFDEALLTFYDRFLLHHHDPPHAA